DHLLEKRDAYRQDGGDQCLDDLSATLEKRFPVDGPSKQAHYREYLLTVECVQEDRTALFKVRQYWKFLTRLKLYVNGHGDLRFAITPGTVFAAPKRYHRLHKERCLLNAFNP